MIYTLRRIFQVFPVLLGISILVFLMLHLMPGDPARNMAGDEADEEAVQQTRILLGLDKPLHIQFFVFIKNMLKGDMGVSTVT